MIKIYGPYSKITLEPINLNSHDQVKKYLLSIGWKPTEWNYKKGDDGRIIKIGGKPVKTSPKITEDSLEGLTGNFVELYREYCKLSHRRKLIENFDDPENKGLLSLVRTNGTIAAEGITVGTPTNRYIHKGIVNIPSVDAFLGQEMRSLFGVPEGWVLIGSDMKGIEARLMAHLSIVFGDPIFAHVLMTVDDIHSWTAREIGKQITQEITRKAAKGLRYAISYGAQVDKVATMLGISRKQAELIIEAFWNTQPGLKRAKEALESALKEKKWIRGLDGRRVYLTATHTLLNYYIQSAAAILFKRWMVIFNQMIEDAGLTKVVKQIIAYHDELQIQSCPDVVPSVLTILEESCLKSGEYYNIQVPIECDCKVGFTWADTH